MKNWKKQNKKEHSTDHPATKPPFDLMLSLILVKSVKVVFSFPNANSVWKIP